MPDLTELADVLADLDTRKRQDPASRNRPITLYAISNETLNLVETATLTTHTPPFKWSTGSGADPDLVWGQGQWE